MEDATGLPRLKLEKLRA